MRKTLRVFFAVSFATTSFAQDVGHDSAVAASRSAHETTWQHVEWITNQLGEAVARTNAFAEIATSLNYYDEATQQFQPSREEWVAYPEGIVALAGRHKVILASPNLTRGGCVEVDVLTPDQARVVCAPVSLGFYDPVDGKQVVLAEVKADSKPEWGAAPNEILFRDCFDRVRGSLRFLYSKAGVHQHVVIEQRLELPEGFSSQSRLECYTVFAPETVAPQIQTRVLRREKDAALRAWMVEPDFTDAEIAFGGEMAMRAGRAFSLGDETDEEQARTVRVGKQLVEIQGSLVLVESVPFEQLAPLLARLASVGGPNTDGWAVNASRQIQHPRRTP